MNNQIHDDMMRKEKRTSAPVRLETKKEKHIRNHHRQFSTLNLGSNGMRWVFVAIFIYIIIGTAVMFTEGADWIRNTIVYSIMGFFTFFMGYFGTLFARVVRELVIGVKVKDEF